MCHCKTPILPLSAWFPTILMLSSLFIGELLDIIARQMVDLVYRSCIPNNCFDMAYGYCRLCESGLRWWVMPVEFIMVAGAGAWLVWFINSVQNNQRKLEESKQPIIQVKPKRKLFVEYGKLKVGIEIDDEEVPTRNTKQ